jgi:hypothetical protein
MFLLWWRHLLLGWICVSQSADFPVSPNVCGATAFGESLLIEVSSSGGSSSFVDLILSPIT